jgi:FMN-dependent oxidoreductase (nitrilotriacetate monooxygenase family)
MHLNAFMVPFGHHPGSWQLPDARWSDVLDPGYFLRIAQIAERGLFDSVFLADFQTIVPMAGLRERPHVVFEPVSILSYIAGQTSRIGLICTMSSSFTEPYNAARLMASLDLLSGGRAGMNLVTSQQPEASRNFGHDALPPHEVRYARAEEYAEIVKRLWRSWPDGLVAMDKAHDQFFDPAVYAEVSAGGPERHFAVAGPLNVPPSPQGEPVFVQAGASPQGRDLAARHAEAIYGAGAQFEDAKAYSDDIKALAASFGRRPEDVAVLPGVVTVIGDTLAEAQERKRYMDSLMSLERQLAVLTAYVGFDCSGFDWDDVFPPLPPIEEFTGPHGRYAMMVALSRDAHGDQVTVRAMLAAIAAGGGHFTCVGTPSSIADELTRWFRGGAADGFNINAATLPDGLEDFVARVVPELQERGVFRTAYEGSTLRAHLRQTR